MPRRKSRTAIERAAARSRAAMLEVKSPARKGDVVVAAKVPAAAAGYAFLAYARADSVDAEALVAALEAQGIHVRWDRQLDPGAAVDLEIEAALEHSRAVIIIWSEASLTSQYVRDEARYALEAGKAIPVHLPRLDLARLPFRFRGLQCCEATDIGRIVTALRARGL